MSNNDRREDEDDATDETPADLALRLPASPERKAFASLELALRSTLRSLVQVRKCWDESTEDRRRAMAEDVEADAREIGDGGHDLARLMREFRLGLPPGDHPRRGDRL